MVEAGANEVERGRDGAGARRGPRGHQADRGAPEGAARARRQAEAAPTPRSRVDPALVAADRGRPRPSRCSTAMRIKGKLESYAQMKKVRDEYVAVAAPRSRPSCKAAVPAVYDGLREKLLQREILEHGRRLDGRALRRDPRRSRCEVGVLPRTHGSALFTRGETQALVTVTLGTSEDAQIIDTVQEAEYRKRFMLHYNFPPFSVGEVKFLRGPGRREIGHGALAERALRAMLPTEEEFPYTIRIVSDILESNGSSSMASRLRRLARADGRRRADQERRSRASRWASSRKATRYAVLTDIAGEEDHYGDMDFKVAGTRDGHHRAADGHQDRRHHAGDHGRGAGAGAQGPPAHPRQDGSRRSRSRAPRSAPTRRASSRSRSRWTRSATSSGRAAR